MDNKISFNDEIEFKINNKQETLKRILVKKELDKEDEVDKYISYVSPVGSVLLDREIGDIVDVRTPGGIIKIEIINIRR